MAMYCLGVFTKAMLFRDIIIVPFLFLPIYGLIHFLIKAKRRPLGSQYLEDRQTKFMDILMKLNQNEFKSRGFRFEVGEKGAWIELHF
jgi:hypothetical protein